MVVRYTETPVGAYDEVLVMPGKWDWGEGRNGRITAIWVSQRDTCWNGEGAVFFVFVFWKGEWLMDGVF